MARIRTIKPEFWDSPGIETMHPFSRLLFVAMWNWADDSGRGKAEARELMGFVFPRDEDMTLAEFRRYLGEVRRVFGVHFYKVAGRSYYAIPSWDNHQKIDKRSGARWPAPEDGEEFDPATNRPIGLQSVQVEVNSESLAESSAEPAEDSPSPRRMPGAGTGEQGNRGTDIRPPVFDVTHDRAPARNDGGGVVALRAPRGGGQAAARLNATARSAAAHEIAVAFSESLPTPLEGGVLTKVGVEIDKCLKAGIPPPAIADGLRAWTASDSWSPTQIPSFVHKAANKRGRPGRSKPTEKAVDAHAAVEELLREVRTLGDRSQ
ncbi:hypothetical protein IU501_22960 [Nocardia otitidiscaviarum]|uniref:hypothetical protein n=1 Tax=Nocardia otitidiscaviarum TaxID=1823 RepID=UPI0004A75CBC|nr:hypothetical protein [Nocardia otitidiscaviarum]MBF6135855.1 hypothetical protein [Nocardia otitidiscaviarum]